MSNSLPTITSMAQMLPYLKVWQQRLNPVIQNPIKLRSPFTFNATTTASAGILLNWDLVRGADGYNIYFSNNGDFSAKTLLVGITNGAQTSFFDSAVASGTTRYYKIAATSGTTNAPQSTEGNLSAPKSATAGTAGTSYDQTSNSSGSGGWNQPPGRHLF